MLSHKSIHPREKNAYKRSGERERETEGKRRLVIKAEFIEYKRRRSFLRAPAQIRARPIRQRARNLLKQCGRNDNKDVRPRGEIIPLDTECILRIIGRADLLEF